MDSDREIQIKVGRADGNNVILRQSWWNQLHLLCVFALIEALVTYLYVMFPYHPAFNPVVSPSGATFNYLPLLPLFFLCVPAWKVYDERLVITPEYLIHVVGRLSWREHSIRLEYKYIQEIETAHSIPQRIFGIADLIIKPVGGGDHEVIHMRGLAKPRAVKDLIRAYRERALRSSSGV